MFYNKALIYENEKNFIFDDDAVIGIINNDGIT